MADTPVPVIIDSGGGGGRGGGGGALETIIILAVLALGAWFVYTRVRKAEAAQPSARLPSLADQGKLRQDSQVVASRTFMQGCPPGMTPKPGGGCMDKPGAAPVDISSSPMALAMAPAQSSAVQLMPVVQALVVEKPAATVSAPQGAVISSQPAPPQSSRPVATSMLSSSGRPAVVVIKPPMPAKPPVPASAPVKPIIVATPPKPATASFVKPLVKPLLGGSTLSRSRPAGAIR